MRALAESRANFWLVAVANGLKEQVLEADVLEDFTKNIEDASIEGRALDFEKERALRLLSRR